MEIGLLKDVNSITIKEPLAKLETVSSPEADSLAARKVKNHPPVPVFSLHDRMNPTLYTTVHSHTWLYLVFPQELLFLPTLYLKLC